MKRRWEIDALRGLMLVLMNFTHLPTRFAEPTGQPFGFVSAAEGFVLLSAFMAGLVYSARARRDGMATMRRAFLMRATKLYGCQAALLLFLFTIIALLGVRIDQPAVKNLMSFYLLEPHTAFLGGLLLIYNPPLLDILPIYIIFMLVSPWLLTHGLRHGWRGIMASSALLWLLAQFDLSRYLYDGLVALTGLRVPFRETGSFEMFAWQFLWVLGLWLGSTTHDAAASPIPARFPRWIVLGALIWGGVCLVWRHAIGQNPLPGMPLLEPLFDKWHLGPLRLLDLFALMVLALVGGVDDLHPLWLDVLIVAVSFSLLWLVAWISRDIDPFAAGSAVRTKARSMLRAMAASGGDASRPALGQPPGDPSAPTDARAGVAEARAEIAEARLQRADAARVSARARKRRAATTRNRRRSGAVRRHERVRRAAGRWRRASA